MQTIRIHLSLASLLKLAAVLGVGYSIASLIIFALVSTWRGHFAALDTGLGALQLVGAAFLQGMVLPIVVTLLGYPFYSWLSRRSGGLLLSGRVDSAHR
jgi:hypothetical protein